MLLVSLVCVTQIFHRQIVSTLDTALRRIMSVSIFPEGEIRVFVGSGSTRVLNVHLHTFTHIQIHRCKFFLKSVTVIQHSRTCR
eukprot:COSAG02_NODE_3890_length_6075_cov_3.820448_1_plen_83_part_10